MLQGINVREKAKALIELIQVAYAMHSCTMRGLRSELREWLEFPLLLNLTVWLDPFLFSLCGDAH